MSNLTLTVSLNVEWDDMVDWIEGTEQLAVYPWWSSVRLVDTATGQDANVFPDYLYWAQGRQALEVVEVTEFEPEQYKTHRVTWNDLEQALRTLSEGKGKTVYHPETARKLVGRLLDGQWDVSDLDVLFQFACFGEQVYA